MGVCCLCFFPLCYLTMCEPCCLKIAKRWSHNATYCFGTGNIMCWCHHLSAISPQGSIKYWLILIIWLQLSKLTCPWDKTHWLELLLCLTWQGWRGGVRDARFHTAPRMMDETGKDVIQEKSQGHCSLFYLYEAGVKGMRAHMHTHTWDRKSVG